MKIIIAGAGAVGTHLARMLSKENLDIVLIDPSEERLSKLDNELDIMVLVQEPTSISALKQAGIESADLFIAVTPQESENLTCCMLAKQLGARQTVARIDNYEYLEQENAHLFTQAGISSLVYPEKLAGQEIAASATYSWVRQWWDFDGNLVLISVKMHKRSPVVNKDGSVEPNLLLGRTLRDIGQDGHHFHVVAIKRHGETIIPYGEEKILPQDLVFFMAQRSEVNIIRHLCGKDNYPQVKHIMILGGSKLAVRADWAIPDNISLKIIEPDIARCEELGCLTKERTLIINGEGFDVDLLRDEGFEHLEAFVALTPNDETNILACVAARRSGVRKTIAQVENLAYLDMAEALDVGTVINKKMVAASHIYRMLLKADVDNVKMLTVADADVAEFVVKEGSRAAKSTIKDIGIPREVNIGGMIRNGKGMLVSGQTQLQAGDKVVVFCAGNMLHHIEKYFK
ncbi:MAG: Trk system potassium transporter TrkA [Prevotellaceae bacterium]|nr:Trk system potassium transporter TrkA [Candidatus Colivivens caballi]